MRLSVLDLRSIAGGGCGMVISARGYSVLELRSVADAVKVGGGQLTLSDLGQLSALDLRSIAMAGGGCVVFNFLDRGV